MADGVLAQVSRLARQLQDAPQAWQRTTQDVLSPDMPFEVHEQAARAVFATWDTDRQGPCPLWIPTADVVRRSNIVRFMDCFKGEFTWDAYKNAHSKDYALKWKLLQKISCQNPEVFWTALFQHLQLVFFEPPQRVLAERPHPDACCWLPGARMNIAHSALHSPRAPPGGAALVWAAEGAPDRLHVMQAPELRQRAAGVAGSVRAVFQEGAALAICMPMTAESVLLYLGIILAGCIVVSISDSFSEEEIAVRLKIAGAQGIFTQDVIRRGGKTLYLYRRIARAKSPRAIVLPAAVDDPISEQLRDGDMTWTQFSQEASTGDMHPAQAAPGDTINILFSSGTTGEPKAIPWNHTTALRPFIDAWAHQDVHPGDVICWPTNLGWMMGPWVVFAALLNGATIALFQGSPLVREFGQFVSNTFVTMLGVIPSIVRSWRDSNCMQGLDWNSIRCFSSTGEASSADDYHWLMSRCQGYRPIMEYCGGTELGGAFLSGTVLQAQAPSTFSTPTLGASIVLLGEDGSQSPHSLNRPFTGYITRNMPVCNISGRAMRRHGDAMQRLVGGYYIALGRVDDTMNLGGIKVSSVELERVVVDHVGAVSEAAAVGVSARSGGPEKLCMFVVLKERSSAESSAQLKGAIQKAISQKLNPLFKVDQVVVKTSLPRTASNKVMRRVLKQGLIHARL